jgi:LytS/YehU family sensor histidine kinase
VEETPEALYIRVEDNGPGIELSRLHSSVGLSNLIFRLEQLFGGEATLVAERLTPGTRVTLRFPRRPPSPAAHNHTQARDLS